MIGIVGYGSYIPRLRLSRKAVAQSNAWYAPNLLGKAKGCRSMINWDEDSITMAVAAARDCIGALPDRGALKGVYLASGTLPFAERLNSGLLCAALTLEEDVEATDITGSQTAALSALSQAFSKAKSDQGQYLVTAADTRKTRAASSQELDYGDGAAALLIGCENVLAEAIGHATLTAEFVDHFRLAGEDVDYHWEERWVRDEGIGKLVPRAISTALNEGNISADQVDRFIFPSTFSKMDAQLAKQIGIKPEAVVGNLALEVGDTGISHGLLLLGHVLESAAPGEIIVLAQFGSGAHAYVFRVTEAIAGFKPKTGIKGWLARGVEEISYTKFLTFTGQLEMERGMRGEQDKKTALTALYRHRKAILGLVGGRCTKTGDVHFPPSRLSYSPGAPALDTQEPYKMADLQATVLSWSAETLSAYMSPPHYYGQLDFDGGGRILMEFTDISKGEVAVGTKMEMVFRIKDTDDVRGFKRYFWKATPVR
jgi:3-hydroxy-3-methylglutaryl CoA synthase